jgi:hypothetical protein
MPAATLGHPPFHTSAVTNCDQIFVLKVFWQILVQETPVVRPTAVIAITKPNISASQLSRTFIRFKKT